MLSEANPASAEGLPALTGALAGSGSLVLVAHASPERRDRIAGDERVTGR